MSWQAVWQLFEFLGGGLLAGAIFLALAWRAERRASHDVTDVTCDVCHNPVDTLPPPDEDERRRQ